MSLADLIRGKPASASAGVATVTLATVATHGRETQSTVASVATVTVASPPNEEIATRWRLIEGDSVREITVWPAESRETIQARYPGTVAAPAPWADTDPELLPAALALGPVFSERDAELLQAQASVEGVAWVRCCAASELVRDPEGVIASLSPQEAVDAALVLARRHTAA